MTINLTHLQGFLPALKFPVSPVRHSDPGRNPHRNQIEPMDEPCEPWRWGWDRTLMASWGGSLSPQHGILAAAPS